MHLTRHCRSGTAFGPPFVAPSLRRAVAELAIIIALPSMSFLSGCAARPTAMSTGPDLLVLADGGRTSYSIVIAKQAHDAEVHAAKELAYYLKQISGANFPIKRDDTPVSQNEIVVGPTNRMSLEDVPAVVKNDNWEGFALVRCGPQLVIIGNIPRATLYGVYDFLDVELGVRWLAPEATHVPAQPALQVAMSSRSYAPPFERRTIWSGGLGVITQNRMNGSAFGIANERLLGGVKWVGRPTHTFDSLVPVEKYFDEHPEYFSEIDGVRVREKFGMPTQLCLTNPDVLRISLDRIRSWFGPAIQSNPQNKVVANVSINDSTNFCKCANCEAVNEEEGGVRSGTLIRFVNAIAEQIATEYPTASIETMNYQMGGPPKTRPLPNVIMQITHLYDRRYPIDDPGHEANARALKTLRDWKQKIGEGKLYSWTRHGAYGGTSNLDPNPNLYHIAHGMRVMHDCGVRGIFAQTGHSRGTNLQELRYYLLSRAMWRPQIDSRDTIEQFCRLYYGAGAEGVLRYIDMLHTEYRDTAPSDCSWPSTEGNALLDAGFIARSDAILEKAEARARTPETKQRVAACRLPIWFIMLERAFAGHGKVYDFPVEWAFKFDESDAGLEEHWEQTTSFDGWRPMRIDVLWLDQGENAETRPGVGWQGTDFVMPDVGDAPVALYFERVSGEADIFIDGVKVGEQKFPTTAANQDGFFVLLDDGFSPGRHTLIVRVEHKNRGVGIWGPVSIMQMSTRVPEKIQRVARRFIEVARKAKVTHISYNYAGPHFQPEKMYYPKIRFFLQHGVPTEQWAPRIRTNADMAILATLPGLKELFLNGTDITDAGLRHLRGLKHLEQLELRFTKVTGARLNHLAGLSNLRRLDLSLTKVDDDAMRQLKGLTKLQDLNLNQTPVGDAGLEHLRQLPELRTLDLAGTRVTDAGLTYLRSLNKLRDVHLFDNSGVTDAGVASLKDARPELHIER